MDIQQKLDEWLANNPDAQKYITKLYYIPEGTEAPANVTHKIRLNSQQSHERALNIGLVVKPQFAVFLDMLLAMVATNPNPDLPPLP